MTLTATRRVVVGRNRDAWRRASVALIEWAMASMKVSVYERMIVDQTLHCSLNWPMNYIQVLVPAARQRLACSQQHLWINNISTVWKNTQPWNEIVYILKAQKHPHVPGIQKKMYDTEERIGLTNCEKSNEILRKNVLWIRTCGTNLKSSERARWLKHGYKSHLLCTWPYPQHQSIKYSYKLLVFLWGKEYGVGGGPKLPILHKSAKHFVMMDWGQERLPTRSS